MQGLLTMRRIGAAMVAAGALAAVGAGPASAASLPVCTARLLPDPAPSSTCSFKSPTDWAAISVEPVGTVTATVQCFTPWGTTTTRSRTVSQPTAWSWSTYGFCSLTLTAASPGATAVGTASPSVGIYTTD